MNGRRELGRIKRVVVKVGSRLLKESPVGRPAAIADELGQLHAQQGIVPIVVSSGAIALGLKVLALDERPRELPRLQAVAAVGQRVLMQNWERAFEPHGLPVGQVLLTHADLADRARFLNARHTLQALLDLRVVPIINENDTVAVEEIKFGDNDRLAALVSSLSSADVLLVLTDVDGLHDGPPAGGGQRIPVVRDVDREAAPLAGGSSDVGTGGMASKVQAAKIAGRSGIPTIVASGRRQGVVAATLGGEDVGTLFLPSEEKLRSRKHWIAYAQRPAGAVVVDDGAKVALVEKRRSLLPSGIREVRGSFAIGDAISVLDPAGREFARGLAGYAAEEVERILGKRSADIEGILGYKYLDEVIHRDDLVVL